MSISSRARGRESRKAAARAARPLEYSKPSGGCYLTDEVKLYRCVGGVAYERTEVVVLEDCQSLDILLFWLDELRAMNLRVVEPISSSSQPRASHQPSSY